MPSSTDKYELKRISYDDKEYGCSPCHVIDRQMLGKNINYEDIFGRPVDQKIGSLRINIIWPFIAYRKSKKATHQDEAFSFYLCKKENDPNEELYFKYHEHTLDTNDILSLRKSIIAIIKKHIKNIL